MNAIPFEITVRKMRPSTLAQFVCDLDMQAEIIPMSSADIEMRRMAVKELEMSVGVEDASRMIATAWQNRYA